MDDQLLRAVWQATDDAAMHVGNIIIAAAGERRNAEALTKDFANLVVATSNASEWLDGLDWELLFIGDQPATLGPLCRESWHALTLDVARSVLHAGLETIGCDWNDLESGAIVPHGKARPFCADDFLQLAAAMRRNGVPVEAWEFYVVSGWLSVEHARAVGRCASPRAVELSTTERELLDTIREIGPHGKLSQSAILSRLAKKNIVRSEGTTKNILAALIRHGILLKGNRLPEWENGGR